ncbi:glutamate receptor ionotropic, NMDA 2B-like isoform X2 [Saccostrea echinata]|uniref:glutamate receptor ionotropic, NMDA 2B-like isoform X2 n=1 Tax=Saccostrea echinata TaxID=191078 RepID=UPI002A8316D9|nr:glutamate receptor ionotropic, NMDA 2B-like isoform X2 [Saccostrea echinata]
MEKDSSKCVALKSGIFCVIILKFFIWTANCQRAPRAELDIILPDVDKVVKSINNRNLFGIMRSIRRMYSPFPRIIKLENSNPSEILEIFCETVFKKNVNALVHLSVTRKAEKSKDYILGLATSLGLPVLSFDPDYVGALENPQNRMVLQLAPTLYHQAQAMLKFMMTFNWTHFTVVSTTEDNNFDFTAALRTLVKKNNDVNILSGQFRFKIMKEIIFEYDDNDSYDVMTQKAVHFFRTQTPKDTRIFLLHSGQAKTLLDAAAEAGLTTYKYLWIVTSQSIGIPTKRASRSYPLGTIGVSYVTTDSNYADSVYRRAVEVGVATWVGALQKLRGRVLQPDFTCNTSVPASPWDAGHELYNLMKTYENTRGGTLVSYDENGLSRNVELNILNVQLEGFSNVWREIGSWYADNRTLTPKLELKGITWPGDKKIPPRGRPERRYFSIATLEEEPYVMYTKRNEKGTCNPPAVSCRIMYNKTLHGDDPTVVNGTIQWCCAGLSIDLLEIFRTRLEFDYDLFEVQDRTCGVKNQKTGQWNGLIRILQEGGADMALTSLQITPSRSEAVEFTVPYLETGTSIIVYLRNDTISAYAILEPYDYGAWCLILFISVHSVGASIFIFEWLSPRGLDQGRTPMREHSFSLFRSFWLMWAMLFGASVSADNPRGVSARFMGNVWALFALVFLASYTANLAAFMITKNTFYDLEGITDWRLNSPLKHQPPFKFGTVFNSSTEENLRVNHPAMFKYMLQYNTRSVKEAIDLLRKGEIQAFIYDFTPLQYQVGIDKNCRLMLVGKPYAMSGYAVAFPKGQTELKEELDELILELQDDGELERLRKYWLSGPCYSKQRIGQSSQRLRELNFTSAFILLASGIVLGGLLLVMEHLYFRFGRKYLKKYDKCGCCALVSLSMGKSLTFEQTIMEAIDLKKKHKCKNPICETQLWKVRHELDIALLKVEKLTKELRRERNLNALISRRNETAATSDPLPIGWKDSEANDKPPDSTENTDLDNLKPDNNIRRSPSYTQAVTSDPSDDDEVRQPERSDIRYREGKVYQKVDGGEV